MSASEVERAREAIIAAVNTAVYGDELSLRDSLPPLLAAFEATVRAEERERVIHAIASQKADAECKGREGIWENIFFTEHGRLTAVIRAQGTA